MANLTQRRGATTTAVKDFATAYNKNALLFVLHKREAKGAQLRNTIINLCN
ncbi:hypothetical protein NTGHW29_270066 [Candidatus Nitrotoga sp. HW29]|nr:hypothetical protein NTGHW29_270066 [Candidatus Nitrotoga sp. HW29]